MASENNVSAQLQATIDSRRADDFTSRYANNVQLEPTLWDLKLTFGQTDQKISSVAVVQHTAITLSWPEAKVLSYFLRTHVAGHEAQVGRLTLVSDIIPALSKEIPQGVSSANRVLWMKAFDAMNKLYLEFIAENPEVAAAVSKQKK